MSENKLFFKKFPIDHIIKGSMFYYLASPDDAAADDLAIIEHNNVFYVIEDWDYTFSMRGSRPDCILGSLGKRKSFDNLDESKVYYLLCR